MCPLNAAHAVHRRATHRRLRHDGGLVPHLALPEVSECGAQILLGHGPVKRHALAGSLLKGRSAVNSRRPDFISILLTSDAGSATLHWKYHSPPAPAD